MKLSSYFLTLFIIKVSLCKSRQKHTHDSESLEGDTLIDKILASDRFYELADKIVEKAINKINNQQSGVTIIASNDREIETKKSNASPNPEFKSIRDIEKKDGKLEKKSKKSQKRFSYKPGKIDIEAVMQKKMLPTDDLTFRYHRFTRNDRAVTASNKPLAKHQSTEKANLNAVNENEESMTKHKIIKKPSADGNSEEQNKSATEEENNSDENDQGEKTTATDMSIESTKLIDSDTTQVTRPQNENPFGNEKIIIWNGSHSDNDNDSEDNSNDGDKLKVKQTNLQVTKEIIRETETTNKIPHLFRAETKSTSSSTTTVKDDNVNEVDDNGDYRDDDIEDIKVEEKGIKNKTKKVIRREGDRTYVLKDSSDYQEYHEQLSKIKKAQR